MTTPEERIALVKELAERADFLPPSHYLVRLLRQAASALRQSEGPRDEEIADEWRDKVCAFIEKQEGFDWNDYRDGLDADLAVEWLRETIDALSRPSEIEKR